MNETMMMELTKFLSIHKDDINKNNFKQIYVAAYNDKYGNSFVRELTNMFVKADLDFYEDREQCLYEMLSDICYNAVVEGGLNLHRELDEEPNWFGYTIFEVIDFLDQISHEEHVQLNPIDDTIYHNAPNYFITEL